MNENLRIVPYREQPELADQLASLEAESFPKFIEEDAVWAEVSPHFYDEFGDFQSFMVDDSNGALVAALNNVPFNWDGNPDHLPGYHDMLQGAVKDWQAGKKPNTLSGVQMIVSPDYRAQGVPELMVGETDRMIKENGITSLMVAVRPTLKEKYPLVPIEEYAGWKRDDGLPFDPWLRSMARMGMQYFSPAPESTVIEDTVAKWEEWTGMEFPVSGEYWLPGGLSTLLIDVENDNGRHCEPHVWYGVLYE